MVMESRDPDPQCVGREFVRQYYTLLHEAPQQLHRFYSNSSCFIHGGVEKPGEEQYPCRGQADIHEKVMSLKFCDCHAKIRQVDSQATVGNAVVVQVTGELSNNRQPMRRFMQTFVLVQQSPKKYYVHNDIFRYQDEVFHDNDTDTEREEEAAGLSDSDTCESLLGGQDIATSHDEDIVYDQPPTGTLSNGTAHLEEPVDTTPGVVIETTAEDVPEAEEEDAPAEEETPKQEPPSPEPEPQEPEIPDQSPGDSGGMIMPEFLDGKKPSTFSWAALASKNPMGTTQPAPPVNQPAAKSPAKPVTSEVKPVEIGGTMAPQPQRAPRSTRDRSGAVRERGSQGGSVGRGEGDSGEENNRKTLRYPDKLQLFVGNLPHNALEGELKEHFSEYGTVVDLKINTKPGVGKTVPNYGFIVYDNPDSVAAALKGSMTKKFRNDHRLNVEEKKTNRPGSGRGGDRGGRGGDRGGLSRGGGPGRGGGRSGPPGGGGGPRPDNRGERGRGGFPGPRR